MLKSFLFTEIRKMGCVCWFDPVSLLSRKLNMQKWKDEPSDEKIQSTPEACGWNEIYPTQATCLPRKKIFKSLIYSRLTRPHNTCLCFVLAFPCVLASCVCDYCPPGPHHSVMESRSKYQLDGEEVSVSGLMRRMSCVFGSQPLKCHHPLTGRLPPDSS